MDLKCVEWTFGSSLPHGLHLAEPGAPSPDSSENHTRQFSKPHGLMKYLRCSLAPCDTMMQESTCSFYHSPVGLLRWRTLIFLRGLDHNAAEVLAHEFPKLIYLRIEGNSQAAENPAVDPNQSTNAQYELSEDTQKFIGKLNRLEVLTLINQNISHLSCRMFQNMKNVKVLNLDKNPRLRFLPERIGEWMPNLKKISMQLMKIDRIPASLVHTLFRNMVNDDTEGVEMKQRGVCVTNHMPMEVLERELHYDRFPDAAAWYGEGRNLRWWENTLIHIV